VARLLHLSRRRTTVEEPSSHAAVGDLDLLPAAIILWIGSVARVAAGGFEDDAFSAEATLALICVVLVPCWLLWSWARFEAEKKRDSVRGKPNESRGKARILTKSLRARR
jgi:membrane protein implicated in regulation of membrane protease activity